MLPSDLPRVSHFPLNVLWKRTPLPTFLIVLRTTAVSRVVDGLVRLWASPKSDHSDDPGAQQNQVIQITWSGLRREMRQLGPV